MNVDVLVEGLLHTWLQPLLYIGFIVCFILGLRRVKEERHSFRLKVYDQFEEIRYYFSPLLIGLGASAVPYYLKWTIPFEFLLGYSLVTALFLLIGRPMLSSITYGVGLPLLLSYLPVADYVPDFVQPFFAVNQPQMLQIFALLLLVETVYMYVQGGIRTSPRLYKSRRGKAIGTHLSQRIWLFPLFLFTPSGAVFFPFILSMRFNVRSTIARTAIQLEAKKRFVVVIVAILGAVGQLYWAPLTIMTIALIVVLQTYLNVAFLWKEDAAPPFYAKQNKGLMILDVLPNTPAEKMVLQPGDMITKVNGIAVQEVDEFYEALLVNRAYCKLDVVDVYGEVRYTQTAYYEGEHHELGVLFIEQRGERFASGR